MDDQPAAGRVGEGAGNVNEPQVSVSRGCITCASVASVIVIAVVAIGLWSAYGAMQAEFNLHSTLYVIRLVDHFVKEEGRWPDSWKELEATPFGSQSPRAGAPGTGIVRIGGAMNFQWPEQSAELQSRVAVDFAVRAEDVIAQDVVEFQPIHPIGPYFPYWKYGFIEELQDSLRKASEPD